MIRVTTPILITIEAETEDKSQWKLQHVLDVLRPDNLMLPDVSLTTGRVEEA